jgi:hypothetical protein
MVASEHIDGLRVVEFEGVEQKHNFTGEGPSVHIVTQEKISGLGWMTTHIKHFDEVVILSMDITYHCHWIKQIQQVRILSY